MLNKSGFLYGTLILIIINFLVRLLGFVYKIALSRLIGPEGIGLFQMVFPILMFFITFTTAGIPVAISKIIAKESSVNNYNNIRNIFKVSLLLVVILSFALSMILIISRNLISQIFLHNNDMQLLLMFVSPSIVLISLSSIFRGYYYGLSQIKISGIAQVIEQITRITFVLGTIFLLSPISSKTGACIALIGISIGELSGLLFLIFKYSRNKKINYKYIKKMKSRRILYQINHIAFPITISRLVNVIFQSINTIIIPQRLIHAGYSHKESIEIFGRVTGMAMPFIFLPFIVTSALVINIIPNLSKDISLKKYKDAKINISNSIRITLIVSIPIFLVYVFWAEPIAIFFYDDCIVAKYLNILGYSTLFLSLQHVLSGILHGIGKQVSSTINYIIGMTLQLILTYKLVGNPSFGINGFLISFFISVVLISFLNFLSVNQYVKIHINIKDFIIKPLLSSVISIGTVMILYNYLTYTSIKNYIIFLSCLILGCLIYIGFLFLTKSLPSILIKNIFSKKQNP